MSNFVQVNVISHSKNNLGYCFEHNVERQKDGEDLEHLLSENNSLGNETITFAYSVVSSGTYEENLRNYYSKQTMPYTKEQIFETFMHGNCSFQVWDSLKEMAESLQRARDYNAISYAREAQNFKDYTLDESLPFLHKAKLMLK